MWDEQDSRAFIDYGRYFVPDREIQIQIIGDLIRPIAEPFHLLELCCGEGLLAQSLLERYPGCVVHGLDGSNEMLAQAKDRLAPFGGRFEGRHFDLAGKKWRRPRLPLQAIVSSLCIHHLDGQQKADLYRDLFRLLSPGGIFVVADLIQPASKRGIDIAAEAWDADVRQRSLELDGTEDAYQYFQDEKWNLYRCPDPVDKPSGLFEQLKWLEEAGFVEVDVFWMKAGHMILAGVKPGLS